MSNWKGTSGLAAVAVVSAALVGVLAWGLLNQVSVTSMSGATRVSKPAPELRLNTYNHGEFILSEQLDTPVLVNVWAASCPPCRYEAPALERLWRDYRDKGLTVVGVHIQDSDEDALAFIRQYGITYPNGPDYDGMITIEWGVIGIPVTFFVNRQGVVERRWVGAINEATTREWADDLIAGDARPEYTEGENLDEFYEIE